MNLMGLDFNGVGNHEFDEGLAELHRMQQGGPHPVEGDLDGDPFSGAEFEFLAANVIDDTTGATIFPPYGVRHYQGVSVAFIGLTLEATSTVVSQAAVEGLTFADEAQVVNALVPRLREQGAVAFTSYGGIRGDILFDSTGSESDGELTYGEAFSVQPFGNSLITLSLAGAQIKALLEAEFRDPADDAGRVLQVSSRWASVDCRQNRVRIARCGVYHPSLPTAPFGDY